MITLHHLEDSRSQRIVWFLEELEVEYQIKRYQRDPKTSLAPPELRDVHPLGRSPVITTGTDTIAESGAIVEYLIDTCEKGEAWRPAAGTAALQDYRFWLHYAEGSLMPYLLLKLVFAKLPEPPMPWLMRPPAGLIAKAVQAKFINPRLEEQFDFIESTLQDRRWFAGDQLTGADIQMSFPLEASAARGLIGNQRPATLDYVKRIHDRPAYQRALERGGDYAYA